MGEATHTENDVVKLACYTLINLSHDLGLQETCVGAVVQRGSYDLGVCFILWTCTEKEGYGIEEVGADLSLCANDATL